jgi:hypothetical protein
MRATPSSSCVTGLSLAIRASSSSARPIICGVRAIFLNVRVRAFRPLRAKTQVARTGVVLRCLNEWCHLRTDSWTSVETRTPPRRLAKRSLRQRSAWIWLTSCLRSNRRATAGWTWFQLVRQKRSEVPQKGLRNRIRRVRRTQTMCDSAADDTAIDLHGTPILPGLALGWSERLPNRRPARCIRANTGR